MVRRQLRPISLLLGLLAAAVAVPAALGATRSASFSLNPVHFDPAVKASKSYFVIRAAPGTTVTNAVRVYNVGSAAGAVALYPVDATTGTTSGAVYKGRQKPRRDVGSWISLGASHLSLAAHSSATVAVTVHVPRNARPGDHLGGIVAQNLRLTKPGGHGALQVRIRRLTIVAVEVQVPGPAAAQLNVEHVRAGGGHGYQYVYVRLANTGDLMVKPRGRLLVADRDGKKVASVPMNLDYVLPGTSIDYPVLLRGVVLAPGSYSVSVELSYGATPLGYRTAAGPRKTATASFPLAVSDAQQRQVFQGAPPAAAPAGLKLPASVWVAGLAALLLVLAAVALLGVRQWARQA